MSFLSFRTKKSDNKRKKLPPHSAWGHYRVRRGEIGNTVAAREKSGAAGSRGEVLISIKDLTLAYESKEVIKNMTLDIPRGAYVSIIGENGSGKSTLLAAILGLKRVKSGEIKLHGLKKDEIGVLPQRQEGDASFPASVVEIVLTGCLGRSSNGPFLNKKAREIAFANMEKVGITSLASRKCGTLSGGQRQRVMLARALCSAEKLLVLDEAVTGIDAKTTADIYSLVESLNKKQGMSIVSVTHDVESAFKYSTHILRLNSDGFFFGSVEEFLALEEAKRYLRKPEKIDGKDIPYGEGGFRYRGGDV